jgi:ATP-dependent Clp protease ATP-binding subunit ClpA
MADHFDKFTEQAKRVLIRSQQEAQRLHHTHIGREHLLLGLVGEEAGGARRCSPTWASSRSGCAAPSRAASSAASGPSAVTCA